MPTDLLLELGSEELPASFILPALNTLENTLVSGLAEARLTHGSIKHYGTPRRLALWVSSIAERQEDFTREVLGPPTKVGFAADGTLSEVGQKFATGAGLTAAQVARKQTPKGEYLFAQVQEKGKSTFELLPALLDAAVQGVSAGFEKSMRWGHETVTWARPLHWIVSLFGEEVVPLTFGDVKSGRITQGHRFLSPEPITLKAPAEYVKALEQGHVYAEIDKRRHQVETAAEAAAHLGGGKIRRDPGLLATVTNLVEWPSAVLGSFDAGYLDLPAEVLVSEMKGHQKYFSVVDAAGKLLPHFVAISNTPSADPVLSRNGYQRVLKARLADARFFFDEDQKLKLGDRVDALKKVVFQQQLGTSFAKMERFRALAVQLAGWTGKGDVAVIERAATLCKADLVTGMVGEFPELQGIMGREYAKRQGEPEAVAVAIDEHYLPRHAGDALPQGDAGALIGIADRLDSLVGLFGIGKKPTGAADPYGLRRACLSVIRIAQERNYRFPLSKAIDASLALYDQAGVKIADAKKTRQEVLDYVRERLKHEWSETRRVDVVEAVLSAGFDDLVATQLRLDALSAIVGQPDFEPLAVAFKRVVNIYQKQGEKVPAGEVDAERFAEVPERELFKAFLAVRTGVDELARKDDYVGALAQITSLKAPVDHFFDKVMVMAEDPDLRNNRVRMLREIGAVFAHVADFSQIQAAEKT